MIVRVQPSDIVYSHKFQGLCAKPYPGHPHGCPNFARKEGCPPRLPLISEVFDFNRELFVIYTSFDVKAFAMRMKRMHPDWAEQPRQLYNPRRWQPKAKKEHRVELERFVEAHPGMEANDSPEAHGVNVTDLMAKVGVKMSWDWPPKSGLIYRVSIGGYLR